MSFTVYKYEGVMAKSKTEKKPGGVRMTAEAKKSLESLAIDPLRDMYEMAVDDGVSEAIRAKLLMELAQYVCLKKKDAATEDIVDEDETSYEEKLERAQDEQ